MREKDPLAAGLGARRPRSAIKFRRDMSRPVRIQHISLGNEERAALLQHEVDRQDKAASAIICEALDEYFESRGTKTRKSSGWSRGDAN